MMQDAIKKFPKQFEFRPEVINEEKLENYKSFVVSGMGGSHLAADLLFRWDKNLNLRVHSNYGLPEVLDEKGSCLYIFSSYSGNTEEVLDGYGKAKERGLDMAVVSVGGKLIEMARADNISYVKLPDTGIQPRSALGFSIIGLLKLMKNEVGLEEIYKLSEDLKSEKWESDGQDIAKDLKDKIPVIYSSDLNKPIAYNWKIKFNETAKIPAFYNVFPELNHNEMTGFDIQDSSKSLSEKFYFLFIKDKEDHDKIKTRMEVTKKLYETRGLQVMDIILEGNSVLEKIFNSLLLADWTAVNLAKMYGLESEQVPMVEEFKKAINN